ncbi:MAG: hypothetical protein R3F59_35745 [Myxococcota bacterium]
MAFTITFPTTEPPTPVATLADWLTEQGEPFVAEGDEVLALRAMPVRFVASQKDASLKAQLEVVPDLPLTRLVDTLFEVSIRAGADVNLAGYGAVTRPGLWLRLADEQDRLRIARALGRAREHGNADGVHKRLWALIAAMRRNHDDRWDAAQERIVERVEVGEAVSVEDAAWHVDDPKPGDTIGVPVSGFLHSRVWRWLSAAYPGLVSSLWRVLAPGPPRHGSCSAAVRAGSRRAGAASADPRAALAQVLPVTEAGEAR